MLERLVIRQEKAIEIVENALVESKQLVIANDVDAKRASLRQHLELLSRIAVLQGADECVGSARAGAIYAGPLYLLADSDFPFVGKRTFAKEVSTIHLGVGQIVA